MEGAALIISHKYKFIFIKTRKTAGTSIEVYLSQHCGPNDVVTPIIPHVEPHRARNYRGVFNPFPDIIDNAGYGASITIKNLLKGRKFFNHMTATAVRARITEETWTTYFKFCVERNPWDKSLSHYHMVNDRAGGGVSIEEYLSRGSFCIDYPQYTNAQGEVLVDQVVRFERLTEELGEVFDKLGVPFVGALGVRAKSTHRKDRRSYREIFTQEQRQLIERAFANEINLHGYVF